MSEFVTAMYHIKREGRHVTGGHFNAADEIFDHIRCQRAGVYSVYRQLSPEEDSGLETAFWGDVAHFGAGKISFNPCPAQN